VEEEAKKRARFFSLKHRFELSTYDIICLVCLLLEETNVQIREVGLGQIFRLHIAIDR